MALKAVILDFDGVIVESLEVKKEAFRKLFLNYPDKLKEILDYHMSNGGLSRYKKFQYIYREILKEDLSEEKSEELGRKFAEYGVDGVVVSPFVKGAEEFLRKYYQKLFLFIASGTPEDEMVQIAQRRGLGKFFKGIYGSPQTKGEIAKKILDDNRLKKNDVIFVGDAVNDYYGARENGIRFIGRIHDIYPNPFANANLDVKQTIRNFKDLESILKADI